MIWTHGGPRKLQVYRRIGVPEGWMWRAGSFAVYALREDGYEQVPSSQLLPELDLDLLGSFLSHESHTQATRAYLAALREESGQDDTY